MLTLARGPSVPRVAHALVAEVPQQLLVLGAQRVQRVLGQDGLKLLPQVVGHLPLDPRLAPRLPSVLSPRVPQSTSTSTSTTPTSTTTAPGVPALGQHHRVAVLVQGHGHGHGGGLVRVGGGGELVGVDAAAALLALLGDLPHVQHELALPQQRPVVHQQQVDVVLQPRLALAWKGQGQRVSDSNPKR